MAHLHYVNRNSNHVVSPEICTFSETPCMLEKAKKMLPGLSGKFCLSIRFFQNLALSSFYRCHTCVPMLMRHFPLPCHGLIQF